MRRSLSRRPATSMAATSIAAASLALLLAACGGASRSTTGSSAASPATTAAAGPGGGGATAGRPPGVSGTVAALAASSMEVQDPSSGQTTVSWTPNTRFDETLRVTRAALAPGVCVTVAGSTAAATLTARSVVISAPTSAGACPSGPGGRAGFFAGGGRAAGSGPSAGGPSGSRPVGSGTGNFNAANFGFAAGRVVSVSGGSLVVYGTTSPPLSRRASSPSTSSTTTPPRRDITVTLSPTTSYTETKAVTAAGLAVGDCVAADGPTDSTGAMTASVVRITSTGAQPCRAGLGRGAAVAAGGSGA